MKFYHPYLVFLDENTDVCASYLSDRFLHSQISHCHHILMDAMYYYVGIRSKRAYAFYLGGKKKLEETRERWFSDYPKNLDLPAFVFYTSKEAKWCRICAEHFMYTARLFQSCCFEYTKRTGKVHELEDAVGFYLSAIIQLGLRGIHVPSANLKRMDYPYRSLPPKYRKRDVIEGYRRWYRSQFEDVFLEYAGTKIDIPEFLLKDCVGGEALFDGDAP